MSKLKVAFYFELTVVTKEVFDLPIKGKLAVIFNMFIQVAFDFSLFKNTFLVHKKAKR